MSWLAPRWATTCGLMADILAGRCPRPVSGPRSLLHQADQVALGVADEGLPLVGAGGPQRVVLVPEDHVRLGLHGDAGGPQPLYGRIDVVDREVVQRTGRHAVEQQ